jgi:hypothetical protein
MRMRSGSMPEGKVDARARMMPAMRHALLLCLLLSAGCHDSRAGGTDSGAHRDASSSSRDAARDDAGSARVDAGSMGGDAARSDPDAGAPTDRDASVRMDAGSDAGTPAVSEHHIHIQVDNFCNMTVSPIEITIPADQTAYFDWHNHSVDYPVDVWMSYGGGYLELETGSTWDEPIGHCATPLAHDEFADISTACSEHRFLIHCL